MSVKPQPLKFKSFHRQRKAKNGTANYPLEKSLERRCVLFNDSAAFRADYKPQSRKKCDFCATNPFNQSAALGVGYKFQSGFSPRFPLTFNRSAPTGRMFNG
jgi:hypothetical protein